VTKRERTFITHLYWVRDPTYPSCDAAHSLESSTLMFESHEELASDSRRAAMIVPRLSTTRCRERASSFAFSSEIIVATTAVLRNQYWSVLQIVSS
jgi:hypothetical protein